MRILNTLSKKKKERKSLFLDFLSIALTMLELEWYCSFFFFFFFYVLEAFLNHFNLNQSKCVFALDNIADFNLYFLATKIKFQFKFSIILAQLVM